MANNPRTCTHTGHKNGRGEASIVLSVRNLDGQTAIVCAKCRSNWRRGDLKETHPSGLGWHRIAEFTREVLKAKIRHKKQQLTHLEDCLAAIQPHATVPIAPSAVSLSVAPKVSEVSE